MVTNYSRLCQPMPKKAALNAIKRRKVARERTKRISNLIKRRTLMPDTTTNKTEKKEAPKTPSRATFMMRRAVALIIIAGILGGASCFFFLRSPKKDQNLIKLSGRIEGDDAAVSAKVGGRLREIGVR